MKGISNKKASPLKLMFMGLGLMVVLGLLVGLFIDEANAAEDERRLKLIMRVDEVKLNILPSQKQSPHLYISAQGVVNSTGWQAPQLVPVDTDCPKSFKCFEFRAKPPTGITNPVITPVSADYKLENWQHVKKIKVIAKKNSITEPVEKPEKLETSQRQDYFGPVLLTKYAVDNQGSYFWVDDPNKLPEKAVAVRVPPHKPTLASFMVSAY